MSDDPQPPLPALDPAAQIQVIDGPSEHQCIHAADALRALVSSGQIPLHARALNLGTMVSASVGEMLGLTADQVVASAGPSSSPDSGSGVDAGHAIQLGERSGGDTAIGQHVATLRADGRRVTGLLLAESVPAPGRRRFAAAQTGLLGLQHENLVQVHAVEEQGPRLAVAVDPLEGRPFSELMHGNAPGLELVANWAGEIAAGLWAAAKKGVHHLALGPELILIDSSNRARLWGFGIGWVQQAASAQAWARSLPYRAPEILRGESGDHRSDIYALAAILYHLLGGRPPFAGSDPSTLQQAIASGAPAPLSERDRRIPEALDLALRSALAADPQHRPQSAAAFAREIRDAVGATDGAASRRSSSSSLGSVRRPSGSRHASSSTQPSLRSPSSSQLPSAAIAPQPARTSPATKLLGLALVAAGGVGAWFGWQHFQQGEWPQPDTLEAPTSDTRPLVRATDAAAPDPQAAVAAAIQPEHPPEQSGTDPARGSEHELLAAWQEAEEQQQWQQAHRLAQAFATRFPSRVNPVRLRMPLLIEPSLAEARVVVDGVESGRGAVIHRYPPGTDALIMVHAPGHQPVLRQLRELHGQSRWQVELQPFPALRWVQVLSGSVSAGPAALDDNGRVVVPCGSDAAIVSLADGSQMQVTLAAPGATAVDLRLLGPALRQREISFLIGERRLFALDNRRTMIRWSLPQGGGSEAEFRLGACTGPHELIPEQAKLWVLGAGDTLRCIVIRGSEGSELASTPLGAAASAGPAMVMIDSAMSAIAVPMGQRLRVFDGATTSPSHPAQDLFSQSLSAPVSQAPLAFRYRDRPWILIADDRQRLLAIDPRPDVDQRIIGEWQLPSPPAAAPLRLGQGGQCIVGLRSGQVVAIDLDRPGSVLWTSAGDEPLTGPPLATPTLVLSSHQDGSLLGIDAASGETRFHHQLGIIPLGSPVAAGKQAMVVSAEGVALGISLE